jgi:microcystin-dependent protein
MSVSLKTNLVSTYGDEAKKIRELVELGNQRTNTGVATFTSATSSVTYDTSTSSDPNILNRGQDGLLYWLVSLLTTPTPTGYGDCIIDAAYLTSLVTAIRQSELIYAEDAGASDSYAIALEITPASYTNGMMINFKANTANTGSCTLNVNGLGAKAIKNIRDKDLDTGSILSGQMVSVMYNGTNFIMVSTPSNVNPVGTINIFSGSSAPGGWLICDGSEISRTTYADLFSVIGTAYGVGNGSSTFNIPNLKGKIPVGYNSSETEFNTIGKTGGAKTHILTATELPANFIRDRATQEAGNFSGIYDSLPAGYWKHGHNTGGGQAHNNIQPYITMNYIIKY